MIRAVLDANVIVSAVLTTSGTPAQILDAWRTERFALLVSSPILDEVARVLEYPRLARLHHWPRAKIREFVAECVVEGAADYLVSGDQDLLGLHEHSGIRIVRPGRS
jgi:predicted nucleic acid-binding protein